jgi:catechol 2,3-dioxygenase-like lactoylglutathione lyase family enzyme
MENTINGIHHITAIAGDAKRNYDFYTRVLGLRMVKKRSILTTPIHITFITATKTEHREQF